MDDDRGDHVWKDIDRALAGVLEQVAFDLHEQRPAELGIIFQAKDPPDDIAAGAQMERHERQWKLLARPAAVGEAGKGLQDPPHGLSGKSEEIIFRRVHSPFSIAALMPSALVQEP